MTIQVLKEDGGLTEALSLKNWIRTADLDNGMNVEIQRNVLNPDEAGGSLIPSIDLILKKAIIEPFSKSLISWLSLPKKDKTFKIRIKRANGSELEIDLSNTEVDIDNLTNKLISFFDEKNEKKAVTDEN